MMAETAARVQEAAAFASRGHEVKPGEIVVGVIIGRASEFFDFFVYAVASVVVFPRLVFPHESPLTGTLLSFAIFSLAFIARPFGTGLFMAVDRHQGRGVKMTIALVMLGTSTVAIAFLPGYDDIGVAAVWLLALARIGQGLAQGGTWDGLASLLAVNAPHGKRGWYAMLPQLGAPIGLIVASLLFAFFVANLSAEDFFNWGWRYPFFVAFAINVVALFARLRIVQTPGYKEQFEKQELEASGVFETLEREAPNVAIGAFIPLASFALFHMVTVFPLSWVFLFTHEGPARFLVIEAAAGLVFCIIAIIASGIIADRIGRNRLLAGSAVAIAAFSGFAPQLLSAGLWGEIAYMVLGFILLGLSFGQSSGSIAPRFSRELRYTGSAITTDFAWLVGAAFAPLVALVLSSHFGLISAGAYLLSGAVCTLLALWATAHPGDKSD